VTVLAFCCGLYALLSATAALPAACRNTPYFAATYCRAVPPFLPSVIGGSIVVWFSVVRVFVLLDLCLGLFCVIVEERFGIPFIPRIFGLPDIFRWRSAVRHSTYTTALPSKFLVVLVAFTFPCGCPPFSFILLPVLPAAVVWLARLFRDAAAAFTCGGAAYPALPAFCPCLPRTCLLPCHLVEFVLSLCYTFCGLIRMDSFMRFVHSGRTVLCGVKAYAAVTHCRGYGAHWPFTPTPRSSRTSHPHALGG
jgi:hypothetical protein